MSSGGIDPWVFFVVPLVVVVIGYLIASTRRGSVSGTRIGSRRHTIHNAADPQLVFDRITAIGHPFRIDDSDPQTKRIVLSTSPTFGTWGFFYPIEIKASPTGGTQIDIGIASKFVQIGPLVTKWHNKAKDSIVDLLGVPAARVAT